MDGLVYFELYLIDILIEFLMITSSLAFSYILSTQTLKAFSIHNMAAVACVVMMVEELEDSAIHLLSR